MNYLRKYKYLQIGIASPEEIISWANPVLQGRKFTYDPLHKDKVTYVNESGQTVEYTLKGEVKKAETINYRTLKPERDGLYCEVIFGPTKDYQCACGKSRKNVTGEHKVCEKCGVELTESKVRRERMGYIALAAPVVHIWYLRNTPSKIAILLDMKTKDVLEIAALTSYIITEVNDDSIEDLFPGRVITEQEHSRYSRTYFGQYKVKTGAEAIKFLLQSIDLQETIEEIRAELKVATKQRREKLIKRLEIVEAFYHSNNKPEWMVMDVIPVIPPDLRPMVQLDGGRFATTDLNDLYRRIISRNTRLRKQIESFSPEIIIKNEKRMLQEAVDSLIDNSKRKNKAALDKNRPLKSLSDILRGKQGRFRQNLLGKRVDYSGRSVIVIGPDLKMYQAGIPREMALILFKPFIINYLRQKELNEANTITVDNGTTISLASKEKAGVKRAKELIERGAPEAMEALEHVVVEHPILLNRAPTLHRLSIQAFEPKLVEGKAIRLHPLVTTAFNADFDGDQMAVHLPLSNEAVLEAQMLMLQSHNILNPANGAPITVPSQDMVLGLYYITKLRKGAKGEGLIFYGPEEALIAYNEGKVDIHAPISVVVKDVDENGNVVDVMMHDTSVGRVIVNEIVPPEAGYINTIISKKSLRDIISDVIKVCGVAKAADFLDGIKNLGYQMAFKGGLSFNLGDIIIPEQKEALVQKGYDEVDDMSWEGWKQAADTRPVCMDPAAPCFIEKPTGFIRPAPESQIRQNLSVHDVPLHLFLLQQMFQRVPAQGGQTVHIIWIQHDRITHSMAARRTAPAIIASGFYHIVPAVQLSI